MIDADNRDGVLRFIARADRARRQRAVSEAMAAATRCPPSLADDAPHLLVVDDDRRIRDLLSRFLFARRLSRHHRGIGAPTRAPSSRA